MNGGEIPKKPNMSWFKDSSTIVGFINKLELKYTFAWETKSS